MPVTLGQIAQWVDGTLQGGDASLAIFDAAPLRDAVEGQITLVDHAKHAKKFLESKASAAIVPNDFPETDRAVIRVASPHGAFNRLLQQLRPARIRFAGGIHPQAYVSASATIGNGVSIGPGASVGDDVTIGDGTTLHAGCHIMTGTTIGQDCEIYPGVVIYPEAKIADRVLIHAGAVIGAYGFGYKTESGRHVRGPQFGWVNIGSDVEIGAGTTIDRGTYGVTRIGDGTKIDNQVQIAHNCHVGRHNLICAQVGMAGSCTTGDYVVLAGQVGMKDHVTIHDRSIVGAQSGVMNDIPAGEVHLGSPAIRQKEQMQLFAVQMRLPEMRRALKQLQEQVSALESEAATSVQANNPKAA